MSDPVRASPWDAAFGSRPGDVPQTEGLARGEAWLAAVALGGRGDYAAAVAVLAPLVGGSDPVIAALAAATLASHRRQLGGHAAARALDGHGLRRLAEAGLLTTGQSRQDHHERPDGLGRDGADARAARSDVLLGLAADAVGLGRVGEARALFGIESASPDAGWRAVVRRGWVAAEIELVAGAASAAVARARAAAAAAARSGSVRHRVKSALVLGAALAAAGERAEALELISGCRSESITHGLRPLRWPSALVLADLDPDRASAHRTEASATLHCVLRHSDPEGRRLALGSPWLPTSGFDLAPNR
ncbi:hypothetical protein [Actinokineospora sp. NBRC 105648]|uniref:hypothetical protein n=1 Tax=Actinokineospora sp. NBRC 105648 TaxID=3032206 RepID=UPI0024A496CF|nr:hypothetical protein [Actinokineospora sp. NBRC 105648]GLZ42089.1 hypothetical protein Acsp05_57130 [Actinokineospora sp. NBRC 105648]